MERERFFFQPPQNRSKRCRSKRGGFIISWIAGKRDGRGERAWPSIIYLSLNPVDASWTKFRLKLTYQASHSSKVKTHKVNNAPRYARFVQRSIRSSPPPALILRRACRATKTGRGNRRQGAAGYHRSYLVIKIIVR